MADMPDYADMDAALAEANPQPAIRGIEPANAEIASWFANLGVVNQVFMWAGMDEEFINEVMEAVGLTDGDHLRDLADITLDDVVGSMVDRVMTVVQRKRVARAIRAARIAAGADLSTEAMRQTTAQEAQTAADSATAAAASAQALLAAATAMQNNAATATEPMLKSPDTICLKEILAQGSIGEVKMIPVTEVQALFDRYETLFEDEPGPSEEVTREQLTALKVAVYELAAIYVDFAIWVPFGMRSLRRNRITGLVLGPDGNLHTIEQYGPSHIAEWLRCYAVFEAAAIMFNLIGFSRLKKYREKIQDYAGKYPACWPLIYQCDVRARSELVLRIKRRATRAKAKAIDNNRGDEHDYDPERPWHYIWDQLVSNSNQWWFDNLVEPAMNIGGGNKKQGEYVDGDAPVAGGAPRAGPTVDKRPRDPAPYDPGPVPKRVRTDVDLSERDGAGHYTKNRKGIRLCPGFGRGSCDKVNNMGRCPHDKNAVHQCGICLGNDHGTDGHGAAGASRDRGRGRARGRGGGRGRGRARR